MILTQFQACLSATASAVPFGDRNADSVRDPTSGLRVGQEVFFAIRPAGRPAYRQSGPEQNARAQVLHFEHFPDVTPWIFDLHQDREGFLWIGSGDGLYRYDGHNFRRYIRIPGDSTSLSGSNIKIIFEDRSGTLWIGTDLSSGGAGLNRYNRETDTFTRFVNNPNDPTSIDASPLMAIHEDRQPPAEHILLPSARS